MIEIITECIFVNILTSKEGLKKWKVEIESVCKWQEQQQFCKSSSGAMNNCSKNTLNGDQLTISIHYKLGLKIEFVVGYL